MFTKREKGNIHSFDRAIARIFVFLQPQSVGTCAAFPHRCCGNSWKTLIEIGAHTLHYKSNAIDFCVLHFACIYIRASYR